MEQRKIKTPCVKCTIVSQKRTIFAVGYDHDECYNSLQFEHEIYARVFQDKYRCVEGYMLTDGSFVNREDAKQIAVEADQVKPMYVGDDFPELKSYMLKDNYRSI